MALTRDQELRYEELRRAKERVEDSHIGRNGVVGMGVGFRYKDGVASDELAIRFYVKDKAATANAGLPASIDGYPIDIIEADFQPQPASALPLEAEVAADPDKARYNPLLGGISIAPSRCDDGMGTLGILVKDGGGDAMMLSNYHVLCLDDGKAREGDEICQEARGDNAIGWCGNCAALVRWATGNVKVSGTLYGVDCAVARLTARKANMGIIEQIGKVTGTVAAKVGMAVIKRGRTTRWTSGVVDDVAATIEEDFGTGIGIVNMRNQVIVKSDAGRFTEPGDSGSVYVDKDTKAVVALHWGRTADGSSVGSPIAAVLDALKVEITTEEDAGARPDASPRLCR